MKSGFLIQAIDSFITGVLAVVLPLMMRDKNIDIIQIGLIFAALPIIFQATRLVFGVLSDYVGRRIFFLSNAVFTLVSNVIYYFSNTASMFLFGKAAEGIREGSMWAVNRAYIMDRSKEMKKDLVSLRVFSSASEAVGNLMAGFLIAWLFYYNTILLCVFLGLALIPVSLSLRDKNRRKFDHREAFKFLDFRKKSKDYKEALILFFVFGLSDGFIANYIFPLFFSQMGMGAETIGIILGVKMLVSSIFMFALSDKKLKNLVIINCAFYPVIMILLCLSNPQLTSLLFVIFGVVAGISAILQECFFSSSSNSLCYGSDISLLMTSFHAARTVSLLFSGFLIVAYGFSSVFILSAVSFVVYMIMTYRMLK